MKKIVWRLYWDHTSRNYLEPVAIYTNEDEGKDLFYRRLNFLRFYWLLTDDAPEVKRFYAVNDKFNERGW